MNKAWKEEEFPFLLPIFVERMATEDDNLSVEIQHQIDPWRSEEQRHTPKINWTQIWNIPKNKNKKPNLR